MRRIVRIGVTIALVATVALPSVGLVRARSASAGSPSNNQAAYDYFLGQGLTADQSAAIVGNFDQEASGGVTDTDGAPETCPTVGQSDNAPPPCGTDNGTACTSAAGCGIAQWELESDQGGGRWNGGSTDSMSYYASENALDSWNLQTQLDFTWYELTNFSYGLSALEQTTTLDEAVTTFSSDFEGCGGCETSNREQYASDALSYYGTTPPASISSFSAAPSTVPAGGGSVTLTADASNASSYAFTSTSSAVTGLGSVDSSSGSAQDAVEIPATQAAVTYTFDVTATGAGGTSAESPVTVTQSAPVYEEAFESNKQQLVTYGSIDQNSDEPMLAAGSSPALAALPGGGTEEAYVNPSGALNLWGSGGSYATGQGVESGTNPSIAAASSGGFEVVFMAAGSGGKLYTWTSTGDKTTDTGQLMAAGSSPTVAAVSGGGYEIAFAAISTGYLCVLGSALDDNTGQGIETGTRAAIAGASSGGFKVAFMAAGTGGKMYTWTSTGEATTNTGQGMQGGTSPAITT